MSTTMLHEVDPETVYAVAVGLEHYPGLGGEDLPGAALNAVRFARWLRGCEVPGQNIALLLAPVDENRDQIEASCADTGLSWQETAQGALLRRHFIETLPRKSAGLLYVYWGGHGVLTRHDERVLYYPDATDQDPRGLGVRDLREYLTAEGFPEQQVLLFDSCAMFVEERGLDVAPVQDRLPGSRRETKDQFLLHASLDGQAAEHDTALRSGAFSYVLLDWLETHAEQRPTPDLDAMEAAVHRNMLERYERGAPAQAPMSCTYRSLRGDERTEPFSAHVDPQQAERLVVTLGEVLPDPAKRMWIAGRVARACGSSWLAARPTDTRFAEMLLNSPRAMATFIGLLRHGEGRPAAVRTLRAFAVTVQPPGLLSVPEYVELHRLLGRWNARSAETVNAATQEAVEAIPPMVRAEADGRLTLDQLMAHVKYLETLGLGHRTDTKRLALPAVLRFVLCLAARPSVSPQLDAELLTWCYQVATVRLGVDKREFERWLKKSRTPHALKAVKGLVPEAPGTLPPSVVVQLSPGTEPDSFVARTWVRMEAGALRRHTSDHNGLQLSSSQVVQLIDDAVYSVTAEGAPSPLVEIVVRPDDLLQVPIHTWESVDDDGTLLLPSVDHRIALRCEPLVRESRERKRQQLRARRWERRDGGEVIHLDTRHSVNARSAQAALQRDQCAARVIICTGSTDSVSLIMAALRLGYPMIMWDSETQVPVAPCHFEPLRPEDEIRSQPERVREYWSQFHENPDRYDLRPAFLLEDHERPLPPAHPLTRSARPEET
ncbi:hypothetical protein R6V09_16185 [Streptomyces sp. W16]|uniref:VMAP-C domain-containing protein n=1 Tax=Streptomyces sp. W16 TaxID=3076631 RepID=UPI00295C32AF|nr:hypothetical protein [Streptomyces sp. W16]MDV9171653.1 hypothetical protein [Streptomyces sp. W16]